MTPMRHYLYCKSDIILTKTDRFSMFSMLMSVCQPSVLWVTSSVSVARSGAFGWHNIFLWKLLQSDVFISADQHIIHECYILYIFSQYCCLCDLAFKYDQVKDRRENWMRTAFVAKSESVESGGYWAGSECAVCSNKHRIRWRPTFNNKHTKCHLYWTLARPPLEACSHIYTAW